MKNHIQNFKLTFKDKNFFEFNIFAHLVGKLWNNTCANQWFKHFPAIPKVKQGAKGWNAYGVITSTTPNKQTRILTYKICSRKLHNKQVQEGFDLLTFISY